MKKLLALLLAAFTFSIAGAMATTSTNATLAYKTNHRHHYRHHKKEKRFHFFPLSKHQHGRLRAHHDKHDRKGDRYYRHHDILSIVLDGVTKAIDTKHNHLFFSGSMFHFKD